VKNEESKVTQTFKIVDLCAGIGGLRLPFESRTIKKGHISIQIRSECVWTSELDRDARFVYSTNFSDDKSEKGIQDYETSINRDFTIFPPNMVPNHDLLLAGFPCQPFSQAGKRQGRLDLRGRVFDAIETIIAEKQPKVVLLENVKGLRSMRNPDGTLVLDQILEALRKPRRLSGSRPRTINCLKLLKYTVPTPIVLNARDFGLPQNRQRLFIIAIRSDVAESAGLNEESASIWPSATHSRDHLEIARMLEDNVPDKYTISPRLWQSHQARKNKNKAAGKGFGYQAFEPTDKYVSTISARYFKDGAEALILQEGKPPRKLTPREGARLQGFPENFRLHSSDMKAFKQIGNAVPVSVVNEIAIRTFELGLLGEIKSPRSSKKLKGR
jgi:DNA (cytosine-5)-methyltransferase 1